MLSPDDRAAHRFTKRLEDLAKHVAGNKLFSDQLETYLDLQENLFQLQMDLQKAIGEVKKRRARDSEVRIHLERLRNLRWLSRRLGDAIAWSALLFNRQVIHALGKNEPVPVPSSWSDGHRGAFQFARSLTSREWGIPIVHDITNMLRIGDVTFMQPAVPISGVVYRTIELKTTRVGESIGEDGVSTIQLNVTAISNEPFPTAPSHPHHEEPSGPSERFHEPAHPRRPDRRIERQMARMDIATARKNAPFHQFTKIGDEHVFSFQLQTEPQPHWKELRRAIRAARKDGFAYFAIGGFVGYSLFYNANGVTGEDIQATPMPDHVAKLMHEEITSRNSITLSALPDQEDDQFSSDVLPLFLWDVPQRAIQDILRHRLVITATYNSGWMEKLLKDAGMVINVEDELRRDSREFEVVAPFSWENGNAEYHMGGPWREMFAAVHEFRGPDAVVQRATMATSLPDHTTLDEMLATVPGRSR